MIHRAICRHHICQSEAEWNRLGNGEKLGKCSVLCPRDLIIWAGTGQSFQSALELQMNLHKSVNPPIPLNLCVGVQISHLLTMVYCPFSMVSLEKVNWRRPLISSRRFVLSSSQHQPETRHLWHTTASHYTETISVLCYTCPACYMCHTDILSSHEVPGTN